MDSIAPTPKTYVFGAASPALALARDEQRTTAVHCLLTLLDYERKPKSQKSKPEDVATPSSSAAEPVGALAAASTASWFQWLDDLLGGLWGPPGAPGAAAGGGEGVERVFVQPVRVDGLARGARRTRGGAETRKLV
jgi:hypothetical protein